jgi:hypothetical protein
MAQQTEYPIKIIYTKSNFLFEDNTLYLIKHDFYKPPKKKLLDWICPFASDNKPEFKCQSFFEITSDKSNEPKP